MSLSNNRLSQLLGISVPIIGAPMAGASGGSLAAQVTLGGGFGFAAAGYDSPKHFQEQLHIARQALGSAEGSPLRIGVGFLCWVMDENEAAAKEILTMALDNRVTAVWFAFGNDLQKWIQFVKDYDIQNSRKTIIFVQLSSVELAVVASRDWKVDVIVAQGIEAGGHGASDAPPLLSLVPSILSVTSPNGPIVVAAGGLATGGHVAALLTLGASGVVLGTRFLLTPESLYTDPQKEALVKAESSASVRTMAFDQARGTLGWPARVDGRGLRNDTVDDFERGEDLEILRSKFQEAVRNNDTSRIVVWAGPGVSLMKEIKPAKEIVHELHEECLAHLKQVCEQWL